MSILRLAIIIKMCTLFTSCSGGETTSNDIDSLILKYNDIVFSDFKGVSITLRDSDFGDDIYMVAKQGGKYPPYIVRFSKARGIVNSIDNKLLKQRSVEDYFSEAQIKKLMEQFANYNACNLSVDEDENVFITPNCGSNIVNLLRLKKVTNEKEIRKGNIYKLYKDNWYINKPK